MAGQFNSKGEKELHGIYTDLKKAKISLGDAIKKLAEIKSGKLKKKYYR